MSRLARILILLACALLAACGSDDSSSGDSQSSATTAATATAPAEPAQTIADARRAVDGDDYDAAVAIARSLRTDEARSVRGRIADRLASRALAALDAGKRGRARRLVIEAKDYPSTVQARLARASYKAAKAQAAQERQFAAQDRHLAARQQRLDEAMRAAPRMAPPPTMQRMAPPPPMQQMAPPPP